MIQLTKILYVFIFILDLYFIDACSYYESNLGRFTPWIDFTENENNLPSSRELFFVFSVDATRSKTREGYGNSTTVSFFS